MVDFFLGVGGEVLYREVDLVGPLLLLGGLLLVDGQDDFLGVVDQVDEVVSKGVVQIGADLARRLALGLLNLFYMRLSRILFQISLMKAFRRQLAWSLSICWNFCSSQINRF